MSTRSDFERGLCRYCGCRRVVGVEVRCGCTGSQEVQRIQEGTNK